MTPAFTGWIATIFAGVRPSIFCASWPIFRIYDALALLKQQRGRGAEINGYISLKQIHVKLLLYACCLEAAAAATTAPQPACFSTAAHSDSVAPVVTISSISNTRLPEVFEGAQQT